MCCKDTDGNVRAAVHSARQWKSDSERTGKGWVRVAVSPQSIVNTGNYLKLTIVLLKRAALRESFYDISKEYGLGAVPGYGVRHYWIDCEYHTH